MPYRGDFPRGDTSLDDVEQRGGRYYDRFPGEHGGTRGNGGPDGSGRKGLQTTRYSPTWQTPGSDSEYDRPGAPGGRFARDPGAPRDYGSQPQGPRTPPRGVVNSKFGPGKVNDTMAGFYDDSYGQLLSSLAQGGQSGDIFGNVLRNFRGGIGDLKDFLESPATRMSLAYGIQNSPEYQQSRDFRGFDTMFQAGAGDIATQAAEQTSQGSRLASRTGQGRNAALRSALAGQASQGAAQRTAGLRGQVQMQRLQQAQRAFEQQRQLAALATGQITPRVEKDGGDEVQSWINTAANVADIFI